MPSQLEIQLTHEVLVDDALSVFKEKLNCNEARRLGIYFVLEYVISAYALLQKTEERCKLAYQLVSRGILKSDSGPNPKNSASYFGITTIDGDPISQQKFGAIMSELEKLTAS